MKLEKVDVDFTRGVVALAEVYSAEVERLRVATLRMHAYLDGPASERNPALIEALTDALRAGPPVWLRIAGIHPWLGEAGLVERREGIARLLSAAEAVYRGELAARAVRAAEVPDQARHSGAPCFYDPWREICHFLQLPMSKLSELCLEQRGLRLQDLGDAIRAEGIRVAMKAALRPLMSQWRECLSDEKCGSLMDDLTESAWAFLKWVRGRGRAGNRKKWAWSRGIPSAGRLNKAVFIETGLTLEELDVEIAVELIQEMLGMGSVEVAEVRADAREVVDCAQSAGLSDVGMTCETGGAGGMEVGAA